jgi:Cdc6-like AAA superfamily ATPase
VTANDALKLYSAALAPDSGKVRVVLKCWHQAIEKAAREGRRSVRESEVGRVRTPIPASARTAALRQLQSDGFMVGVMPDGDGESETTVSW